MCTFLTKFTSSSKFVKVRCLEKIFPKARKRSNPDNTAYLIERIALRTKEAQDHNRHGRKLKLSVSLSGGCHDVKSAFKLAPVPQPELSS